MKTLTGIEVGPNYCVLVRARRQAASIEVTRVRTLEPSEWPSSLDARVSILRDSRLDLDLPRRATVVAWDRSRFNMSSGEAMFRRAGFVVDDILSPSDTLALLAGWVPRGSGGAPVAWLSINQHGAAIAVIRHLELIHARELAWRIQASEQRAQAHLLRRYLYVAQLVPELRRVMDAVREQLGARVDLAVTCGNLPDLRSLAMSLIEELNVEIETLDSLEGLSATDEVAVGMAQVAAIRLAVAAAAYGQAPAVGVSVFRWLVAGTGLVLAAGLVWGSVALWSGSAPIRSDSAQVNRRAAPSVPRAGQSSQAAGSPQAGPIRELPPQPEPTTGVVVRPAEQAALPRVDGILISSERRLAVIEGAVAGLGDRVAGRILARIEADGVTFREASGRLVRVPVRPSDRR